jgi:predicted ATPase
MRQIAQWLDIMGLGKHLDVNRVGSSDLFGVDITLKDDVALPIADLGYGLSQVLPVLAQCSYAPQEATLLFEQPELHLHSIAARQLAKVFIETIREKRCNVVAETHSPELFLQVVRELRAGNLKLDEVAVYKVFREGGRTVISAIEIDPETYDVYEQWERGITR